MKQHLQHSICYLWQCEWYESAGRCVKGVDLLRHLAQHHGEGQVEGNTAVRVHYYHLEGEESRRRRRMREGGQRRRGRRWRRRGCE